MIAPHAVRVTRAGAHMDGMCPSARMPRPAPVAAATPSGGVPSGWHMLKVPVRLAIAIREPTLRGGSSRVVPRESGRASPADWRTPCSSAHRRARRHGRIQSLFERPSSERGGDQDADLWGRWLHGLSSILPTRDPGRDGPSQVKEITSATAAVLSRHGLEPDYRNPHRTPDRAQYTPSLLRERSSPSRAGSLELG